MKVPAKLRVSTPATKSSRPITSSRDYNRQQEKRITGRFRSYHPNGVFWVGAGDAFTFEVWEFARQGNSIVFTGYERRDDTGILAANYPADPVPLFLAADVPDHIAMDACKRLERNAYGH
jgi:hypothetical protein